MKTILTLATVLLTGTAADAKCRLASRSRSVTTNKVVTVQTSPAPAPKTPAPKAEPKTAAPVAAPTALASGCSSGSCRTSTSTRFRFFTR